jgi:hypothetical protein
MNAVRSEKLSSRGVPEKFQRSSREVQASQQQQSIKKAIISNLGIEPKKPTEYPLQSETPNTVSLGLEVWLALPKIPAHVADVLGSQPERRFRSSPFLPLLYLNSPIYLTRVRSTQPRT